MNDLMTRSFQSYVELKKQEDENERDLELGKEEEENLSQFFEEVQVIKKEMKEITDLLLDLQNLNEETKSTYSAKILRGLRDRMDSDMVAVLRKTKNVKARIESLHKSSSSSSNGGDGNAVDRTKGSITNGLRGKLKEIMSGFQSLRDKIMLDYKEGLKRRYYNTRGEYPSEEVLESMVKGGNAGTGMENKERHEAVMDIWRSLNKLHQVYLDMAVMVENQGEQMNDIERNVAVAGSFISGGTNSLLYAKQMKKKKKQSKKWVCWLWAVGFLIVLVCLVAMFTD